MDKIALKGCGYNDGEWEIDFSTLTHRELHTVKRIAGVRVGEMEEAVAANDTDVMLALAIIALQRHGREIDEDALWDAEVGGITYVEDATAVPEKPLDPTPPPVRLASNGGSGDATSTSSGLPASLPSPTGAPI